ncbi:hypothetical protein [Flavilitoribacter nigricans]|uniref:Uncharacterized protein n=1 Tax=Flavilitoribacter nigricans (strain ATCC 23147 / DSM 23189 / NBRC 102662 / NCIMB 1420 / SS-2) TaxID=1122177 RepID=A0A2D0N205_FLAN2|nr:hypothetical protein [Flavilitoribacter nigricans]PHN02582.1 hypothetical protein CRP01_31905 [Flavilitoribacter nigricans DSM 23189 = NBRC 102662]
MGWDTEIVILAENIKNDYNASQISYLIYEKDAKNHEQTSCFVNSSNSLFYHYERRKHAPFWIIQEISSKFNDVNFTILASCPNFVGGPAGLIRISAGEIIDSYGIGDVNRTIIRESIISEPLQYISLIYDWFRFDGSEEKLRTVYLSDYTLDWCEENFVDKIIPIPETDELIEQFNQNSSDLEKNQWKELKVIPYNNG